MNKNNIKNILIKLIILKKIKKLDKYKNLFIISCYNKLENTFLIKHKNYSKTDLYLTYKNNLNIKFNDEFSRNYSLIASLKNKNKNKNLLFNIKKLKKIKSLKKKKIQFIQKNKFEDNFSKNSKKNQEKKFNIFNNILYNLFKKKIININFNYFIKTKIKRFKFIVKKILNKNNFIKKTTVCYKILKLFISSIVFKDTSILMWTIKNTFENVHYSKHKIYFVFWGSLVKKLLLDSFKKLGIFGVKLEFHGKLGVGGDSKKRSYYYHAGRCSNSTKIFKIDSSHSIFKTETGVVGFTYTLYY